MSAVWKRLLNLVTHSLIKGVNEKRHLFATTVFRVQSYLEEQYYTSFQHILDSRCHKYDILDFSQCLMFWLQGNITHAWLVMVDRLFMLITSTHASHDIKVISKPQFLYIVSISKKNYTENCLVCHRDAYVQVFIWNVKWSLSYKPGLKYGPFREKAACIYWERNHC